MLRREFDIDLEHCPLCCGELRTIAAIEEPAVKAMQAQVDVLASGLKLTMPSKNVAKAIAKRGFSNAKIAEYTDGASPLGRLEWPSLVRMLDRIDPSYRN